MVKKWKHLELTKRIVGAVLNSQDDMYVQSNTLDQVFGKLQSMSWNTRTRLY